MSNDVVVAVSTNVELEEGTGIGEVVPRVAPVPPESVVVLPKVIVAPVFLAAWECLVVSLLLEH